MSSGVAVRPSLVKMASHVRLDRLGRQVELAGDGRVAATLGHERQHVALTIGEVVEPDLAGAERRKSSDTIDGSTTNSPARHPAHGVDQLAGMADAVLEQVADAAGSVGHQLQRVVQLEVLREQQHAGAGPAGADLTLGLDALRRSPAASGCRRRRRRAALASTSRSSPAASPASATTSSPASRSTAHDALADEDAVVGYDDAHGSSARTFVPAPGPGCPRRTSLPLPRPGRPARSGRSPPWARPHRHRRRRSRGGGDPVDADAVITTWRRAAVAHGVGQGLAGDEVRGRLDGRGHPRRPGRRRSPGAAPRSATDRSAASRPLAVRTAGWMPRARSRSSSTAAWSSSAVRSSRPATAS